MLRNYFKIAVRNLTNHKFYSFINITGLAVSITCCILISLFVIDELSYDKFYKDGDQLYRTNRHGKYGDNEFHFATAPAPFAKALVDEIPEVERAVRFRNWGSYLVKTPEMTESYKETTLVFADPGVFELLEINVISGSPSEALAKPMSIALGESVAKKYFGSSDIVGKTIILDGDEEYQIGAVFEDFPENSHLNFDFMMTMLDMESSKNDVWVSNNFYTYFKVREGTDISTLGKKINEMSEAHLGPQLEQYTGHSMEEFKAAGNYMTFELQPMDEVYLHSNFTFDIGKTGDITYVYLFMIVAIFILVIACINFMNLSTARSANRAKEVGVRKVLGSYKSHLVKQFLTESVLLSGVAFIISVGLVAVCLPFFNQLADKSLSLPLNDPFFYLILLGGAIFIGFLAGIYPAFFLSSFKPVNVLKGKLSLGSKSGLIRSGLVVFQFFISIILLIGTATVYRQLDFIKNKKIGFNKEQVLMIGDAYMLGKQLETFKKEITQLSFVKNATVSGFVPVNGYNRNDNTFWEEGKQPTEDNLVSMQFWKVDEDYMETMGLNLTSGRNFNDDLASDSSAIILNQTAFKAYNLEPGKENWIQTFDFDPVTNTPIEGKFQKFKVIGVVEDFHYESMRQPIGNLALRLGKSSGVISARLNTTNYSEAISGIEEVWKKFAPQLPYSYKFLDSEFGEMYETERRLARVFTVFAVLAIFIGCLGLFALAAFMADQRTKEIGIRKVMGASVKTIVMMLSKEFSKLIIIAFILAAPLAWWGINSWLSNYSYKIEVGLEIYLISGLIAFAIAWITVGYQAIKAATSNPVKSLRSE